MSMNEGRQGKDQTKMMTIGLITIGLVLLLVVPLLGVLIMGGDEGSNGDIGYQDQSGAVTGDASMDAATQEAWEDFLSTAPTVDVTASGFDTNIEIDDLDLGLVLRDIQTEKIDIMTTMTKEKLRPEFNAYTEL